MRPLVSLVLLLALSGVGLQAGAQAPATVATSVEVEMAPATHVPHGTVSTYEAIVTYRYDAGAVAPLETRIEVAADPQPPWILAAVHPRTLFVEIDPTTPMGGESRAVVTVQVATWPDAPAFEPGALTIVATAAENGVLAPSEGRGATAVTTDFASRLNVTAPPARVIPAGALVPIPLVVSSFANGPAEIRFWIEEQPAGLRAVPPGPLRLASHAWREGPAEALVLFGVERTGGGDPSGALVMAAEARYAHDPQIAGERKTATVWIAVEDRFSARELLVGAGVFATALLIAWRRR